MTLLGHGLPLVTIGHTVKSRFNESQFNVKSRFKVQNLVTKMKFHIKKTLFSVKSRFKELKGADGSHSLNRDFTVFHIGCRSLDGYSLLFSTNLLRNRIGGRYIYFPPHFILRCGFWVKREQFRCSS